MNTNAIGKLKAPDAKVIEVLLRTAPPTESLLRPAGMGDANVFG